MVSTRSGRRTSHRSAKAMKGQGYSSSPAKLISSHGSRGPDEVYDIPSHSTTEDSHDDIFKMKVLTSGKRAQSSKATSSLNLQQKRSPSRSSPRAKQSRIDVGDQALMLHEALELAFPSTPSSNSTVVKPLKSRQRKQGTASADRPTNKDPLSPRDDGNVSAPVTPSVILRHRRRSNFFGNTNVATKSKASSSRSAQKVVVLKADHPKQAPTLLPEQPSTNESSKRLAASADRVSNKDSPSPELGCVSAPPMPSMVARRGRSQRSKVSDKLHDANVFDETTTRALLSKPSEPKLTPVAPNTPSSKVSTPKHLAELPCVSTEVTTTFACKELESCEASISHASRSSTIQVTPKSINTSRTVRFCNESANEVHIIPAVKTTLPFAEQMTREREAEAEELLRSQAVEDVLDEVVEDDNFIPKCGRIVIGKRYIAVDRFVRRDECRYHFLTHAHVDHFVTLSKTWKLPIYCSELTAKIMPVILGAKAPPRKLFQPLKVGETHTIEPNLQVTVLEANHCLGSVMFLFEGASVPGGSVLCTGDFRADEQMLARFENDPSFQKLAEAPISKIYLDNTNFDLDASVPQRSESVRMLLEEMDKLRDCSVLIPLYNVGREEVLERLSEHLSEPISISAQRLAILKACDLKRSGFSDETDTIARIRTSRRQQNQVLSALKKMTKPVAVVDLSLRDDYKDVITENLVSVPYSDHSSREEIRSFLSRLHFGELVPTGAPLKVSSAEELMKLSREKNTSATADDIQTNLECRTTQLDETEISTTLPVLKWDWTSLEPVNTNIFETQGLNLADFAVWLPEKFATRHVSSPIQVLMQRMSCVLYMNSPPMSDIESTSSHGTTPLSDVESASNHEDVTMSLESGTSCYANSTETVPSSSPPAATAPLKKFRNVRKSNIYSCVVCGDKPTGYHYDVLSCNGCKTFFRRTIINNRKFSCTKGGTCQFNKDFRCACRACRFAKCINVGMNAKGIQFPSRANVNIQEDCDEPTTSGTNTDMELSQDCTAVENYSPRSSDSEVSTYSPPVQTRLQGGIPHLDLRITEDFKLMNLIDSLVTRENCTKYLRRLDYPVFCESTLKKLLKEPTIIGRLKFDKSFSHSQLNQYRENPIKFWMVVDLFLAVEYAKTFQCFANLCEDDKQKLLGHAGGLIVIASQAFYTLEQKEESITFPDGINALRLQLQQNRRHQFANYYRETYARPVDLIRTLCMTSEQFALFKAILLFSPNDLDLTPQCRAEIDAERERLTFTLRKCLIQELGPSAGFEKLANILLAIATLVELSEKRRNYLEVCDLMSTVTLSSLAKSIYLKRFNL